VSDEFAWVQCPRCGKERQVDGDYVRVRLAEMSLCRACDVEMNQERNSCPESILFVTANSHGVSACSLEWKHSGRCEPFVLPSDNDEQEGR
jgi:hypothetical protein